MPIIRSEKKLYPMPTQADLKDFLYAEIKGRYGLFVAVYPPATGRVRTPSIRYIGDGSEMDVFTLKLPWVVFVPILKFGVGISSVVSYMAFTKRAPNLESRIYSPQLPNVSTDGWVCMGHGHGRPWNLAPVKKYVDGLYQDFWLRPFTRELGYDYVHLKRWSDATKTGGKMPRFYSIGKLANLISAAKHKSRSWPEVEPWPIR